MIIEKRDPEFIGESGVWNEMEDLRGKQEKGTCNYIMISKITMKNKLKLYLL